MIDSLRVNAITAPRVFSGMFHQACANGVQFNEAAAGQQQIIAVDLAALKSSLPQVAAVPIPFSIKRSICNVEALHGLAQGFSISNSQYKMKMIRHQHEVMQFQFMLGDMRSKQAHIILVIPLFSKDQLAVISLYEDVVRSSIEHPTTYARHHLSLIWKLGHRASSRVDPV